MKLSELFKKAISEKQFNDTNTKDTYTADEVKKLIAENTKSVYEKTTQELISTLEVIETKANEENNENETPDIKTQVWELLKKEGLIDEPRKEESK